MAKGKGQNNITPLTNQQLNSIKGLLGISNDWLEKIYNAIISNSNGSSQPNNQQQNTQNQQQPNNQQQNGNQNQQQNSGKTEEEKEQEKLEQNNRSTKLKVIYDYLKAVVGIVATASNKWMEIEDRVKKVGRSIGMSHEQVRGYQQNIMKNYGTMAAQLGMTIDELTQFQEKYTKSTGRAVQISQQQVKTLASASKLVGEVATNKIVENMDNFGASTKTATSYLALNMARAKANGLDAQKASEAFADNVKLASKYTFSEGINGISKMTLLSQKLKFNMESVANAAEKFETIEGAISTAANLQMLGGTFAQQFSNPLEAMNMAMLDMEGFTDKVINSVKGKATFNRETGQIKMSAMDMRFIKEASKQLGISYDEMYNMAVQPTKIREIERELRTDQNFDETEKAFLANKAEYDPESKSFKITYFDEQGNEQQADISKISKDQLRQIRQQHDVDKAIYGDVHSIHGMLQDYLRSEGIKSTSMKEHLTGIKEASATTAANIADNWMHTLSGWTKSFASSENAGLNSFILGAGTTIGGVALNQYANTLKDRYIKTGSIRNPNNPSSSGGWTSRLGSGFTRTSDKTIRRAAGAKGGKIGVKGGALVTVGLGAYNAYDAYNTYDKQKEEIENSSLSAEDKAKAKTEAKRERNKSYGNAAGSTAGALLAMGAGAKIGAAVGTAIPIPVVGTAVGALAGAAIGLGASWLGGKIGESIGEAVTSEEEVQNENAQPLASVTNDTTTNIINGEREKEYLAVTHISHGVDSVNGYLSQMVSGNGRTLPVNDLITNNKNIINHSNDNNNVTSTYLNSKNGNYYLVNNNADTNGNFISTTSYANTRNDLLLENGVYNTKNNNLITKVNVSPINNNLLSNGTYDTRNNISTSYANSKNNDYYLVNNNTDNNGNFISTSYANSRNGNYYLANNTNIPINNNDNNFTSSYVNSKNGNYYLVNNNADTRNNTSFKNSAYGIKNTILTSSYSNSRNGNYYLVNNNTDNNGNFISTSSSYANSRNGNYYLVNNNADTNGNFISTTSYANSRNGNYYLANNTNTDSTNNILTPTINISPINNKLSLSNGTYDTNNIISTPTIGTPTYVNPKKDNNYYLTNNTNTPTNNNINLNVNGSLRLIGDNSVGNIDINTLLKDSNFINELKSILIESLNQSNGISSPKGAYANMVNGVDNNFNYGTLTTV